MEYQDKPSCISEAEWHGLQLGLIVHPVKPVWCDNCEAWHVECEYGCCATTESEEKDD